MAKYFKDPLKFATKKQIAKKTGVTTKTVGNWEKTGNFPERYQKPLGWMMVRIDWYKAVNKLLNFKGKL